MTLAVPATGHPYYSYADESDRIARAEKASELARQAINTSILLRYLAAGEDAEQLTALFSTAESFFASVHQIGDDQATSTTKARPLEYALPYSRLVPVKVWRQLSIEADIEQVTELVEDLPDLLVQAKQGNVDAVRMNEAAAVLEQVARRLLAIASLRLV